MSQDIILSVLAAFNGKATTKEITLVVGHIYNYKDPRNTSNLVSDKIKRLRGWKFVILNKAQNLWEMTAEGWNYYNTQVAK